MIERYFEGSARKLPLYHHCCLPCERQQFFCNERMLFLRVLRQDCQRNINALAKRYSEIAKASGAAEKRQRMTVEGFRAVKVKQDAEKGLTKPAESDTIQSR